MADETPAYAWTPAETRAYQVFVTHQRRDTGSCSCGWVLEGYGGTQAAHLLEQLSEAGLLVVELPQRMVDLGARPS